MRNANFRPQALQVKKLPDPSGAQTNKLFKQAEIFKRDQLAEIPLDIGLKIVTQHTRRIKPLAMDTGIEPVQNELTGRRGKTRSCRSSILSGNSFKSAVLPARD